MLDVLQIDMQRVQPNSDSGENPALQEPKDGAPKTNRKCKYVAKHERHVVLLDQVGA